MPSSPPQANTGSQKPHTIKSLLPDDCREGPWISVQGKQDEGAHLPCARCSRVGRTSSPLFPLPVGGMRLATCSPGTCAERCLGQVRAGQRGRRSCWLGQATRCDPSSRRLSGVRMAWGREQQLGIVRRSLLCRHAERSEASQDDLLGSHAATPAKGRLVGGAWYGAPGMGRLVGVPGMGRPVPTVQDRP